MVKFSQSPHDLYTTMLKVTCIKCKEFLMGDEGKTNLVYSLSISLFPSLCLLPPSLPISLFPSLTPQTIL